MRDRCRDAFCAVATQSSEQITISLPAPSARYVDEFISSRFAPDILPLRIFPNTKEITESFAAHHAARKFLRKDFPLNDPNVNVICIGDGNSPRTAATFAFRSAWNAISVDPRLKVNFIDQWESKIKRLTCIPKRIQNWSFSCEKAVIVLVHSHAPIIDCLNAITATKRAIIAIPCCVPMDIEGWPPNLNFLDYGIWSPKRRVKIWTWI